MNIESKSYLAKLLATEDIAIEHANVPTAAFDLKARKIILPNWKDMPDFLYDLLIGHEVGHGLVTPPEGWHDAVCSKGAGFKSFLNVIEDARNERLVKQRYPGLVKSFYKAYRYLFEKDFFGVGDTDVNTLSFIDRINLHYKIGSFLNVQFSDTERETLARIDVAEEWDDVVDIATDIYDGALEEMEDQQPENQSAPANGEDDSEETEGQGSSTELSDDAEDTDDPTEGEGQSGDADGEESDDESAPSGAADAEQSDEESDDSESGEASAESGTPTQSSEESVTEPMSDTDQSFRQNEGRLLDDGSESVFTAYVPKFISRAHNVLPSSETWNFEWKLSQNYYEPVDSSNIKTYQKVLVDTFRSKNKSAINQLVMQFEMKRKASELRKAQVNNTGKLNEDKLWAYKLTEDLFLSNTIMPSGQNHGMFMIIDFSGSMAQHMAGTLEQLLIQVAFCKQVGIPFDVYGFSSQMPNKDGIRQSDNENEVSLCSGSGLVQLITSESSPAQYKKEFENLLMFADCWSAYTARRWRGAESKYYISPYDMPRHMQLGSTPLASAMMIAIDVAKEFKDRNRIEVMNTIVLSDGGNTDEYEIFADANDDSYWSEHKSVNATKLILKRGTTSVMVRHPKSVYRNQYRLGREISLLAGIAMFRKITGSRMVNFWICSKKKSEVKNAWNWVTLSEYTWAEPQEFSAPYKSHWMKKDYMAVDSAWGYDQTFLIKGGADLEIDDAQLDIKSDKKSDVLRGFRQFQSKKSNSRHFINRFVDMVA
jgi:hypothetical protein